MTEYARGFGATLSVQWYEYVGGPASNVTGQTVTITRVSDAVVVVGPTSSGISNPALGLYTYTWPVPDDAVLGDYSVVWEADNQDQASEIISLIDGTALTWATLGEVYDVVGTETTISQESLSRASSTISIYANRTPDVLTGIHARDIYWLKQACAWQAVWDARNVDVVGRTVTSGFSQDGLSVTHTAEWNVSLAPMAARSLKNLSWKGTRTIRVRDALTRTGSPVTANFTLESSDENTRWSPL